MVKGKYKILLCTSLLVLIMFTSCSEKNNYYNELNYRKVKSDYYPNGAELKAEVFVLGTDTSKVMLKYYYRNGNIKAKAFYFNNENEGPRTLYYENGNKYVEESYINGLRAGEYRIYTISGKLEIEGKYKMDKEVGACIHYDTITGKIAKIDSIK